MKILCLILCQGEVCTNDSTNANANANDDGQSMIVQGSLVDKPNEPKTPLFESVRQNRNYFTRLHE